jgi:hypothetical protein
METEASGHAGDEKDAGGDIVEIRDEVPEVWLLQGSKTVYFQKPDLAALPKGDLSKSAAHWQVAPLLLSSVQLAQADQASVPCTEIILLSACMDIIFCICTHASCSGNSNGTTPQQALGFFCTW